MDSLQYMNLLSILPSFLPSFLPPSFVNKIAFFPLRLVERILPHSRDDVGWDISLCATLTLPTDM